jgi:hypothetical protein
MEKLTEGALSVPETPVQEGLEVTENARAVSGASDVPERFVFER